MSTDCHGRWINDFARPNRYGRYLLSLFSFFVVHMRSEEICARKCSSLTTSYAQNRVGWKPTDKKYCHTSSFLKFEFLLTYVKKILICAVESSIMMHSFKFLCTLDSIDTTFGSRNNDVFFMLIFVCYFGDDSSFGFRDRLRFIILFFYSSPSFVQIRASHSCLQATDNGIYYL